MGVKQCSRAECGSVMCDRYSEHFGYICQECFQELVELGVAADIKAFMSSEKARSRRDDKELAHKRFDRMFPDCTEEADRFWRHPK